MGTNFCALSKVNFAVSKMHIFVKMVLSIQYIIRYLTSKNTVSDQVNIKYTQKLVSMNNNETLVLLLSSGVWCIPHHATFILQTEEL